MRDRILLAGVIALAALGVLVDFASALFSGLADAAFMGAAVVGVVVLTRSKDRQIAALQAEVTALRHIGASIRNPMAGARGKGWT